MRTIQRVWGLGLFAALLLAVAAQMACAQDSPPTRVGRLSYIGGSVSFEPTGTEEWAAAQLNRPVTIGDRIWTDWDSRAEIEIGDAVIRLGSRTGFSFLNLNAETAQMQLTAGTLIVHVRTLSEGERDEVDTPNLALSLEQPGMYRVHVDSSGDTTVVEVISGRALASGGGQAYPLVALQRATFSGNGTLSVAYTTVGAPDALDEWSMNRDREEARAAAEITPYVSPDMVGIYDLGIYGNWQETPQWGYAWFPNVVAGWAPYRFGHWVWVFPWGWTWLDNEPWGFAPFHYGRWAHWHNAWCWIPGPRHVRPVYAPALVAWTRGRRLGGRRSGAHVGWLPLGPRDVYLPGYAASRSYVRDINLTNARDLTAAFVTHAYRHRGAGITYGNRHVPGAITAIRRSAFTASEPADAHRVVFTRRGLQRVRVSAEAPAVTPSRASVFGAHIHSLNVPPRQLTHRTVVARLVPARAAVSFARQQVAIRTNGGRALTTRQWRRLRPNTPVSTVRLAPDVRGASPERARRHGNLGRAGARRAVPARNSGPAPRYRRNRPNSARSPRDRIGGSGEHARPPSPRVPTMPRRAIPQPQRHVPPPRYRSPPRQHVPRPSYHVRPPRRAQRPPASRVPSMPRRAIPQPQRHVPPPRYRSPPRRAQRPPAFRSEPHHRPPFATSSTSLSAPPVYRVQRARALTFR